MRHGEAENLESKPMASYLYYTLFYAGIYSWVIAKDGRGLTEDEWCKKVIEATSRCDEKFHEQIRDELHGCEYDQTRVVEFVEAERHIRFPEIIIKHAIEWRENPLKLEVRIRINPCIRTTNGNTLNGRHSKVWIIIRVLDKIELESDDLEILFRTLERLAKKLELFAAAPYLLIIDDENQRGIIGTIVMRTAAMDSNKMNRRPKEFFTNLDAPDKMSDELRTNSAFGSMTSDLVLLSTLKPFNGNGPAETSIEKIVEEISDRERARKWRKGETSDGDDLFYRIEAGADDLSVGGILWNHDATAAVENLHKIYRQLARNYSRLI